MGRDIKDFIEISNKNFFFSKLLPGIASEKEFEINNISN